MSAVPIFGLMPPSLKNNPAVAIRTALLADADMLSELARKTFYDTYAPDNKEEDMHQYLCKNFNKETIANELQQPDSRVLIAEVGGNAVGYVKVVANDYLTQPANRNAREVERLYVTRKYQGYKIGYSLIQECISNARKDGASILWLGVWEHNIKAIAFYTKIGFTRTGEHPFVLGNDVQTDWIMELTL